MLNHQTQMISFYIDVTNCFDNQSLVSYYAGVNGISQFFFFKSIRNLQFNLRTINKEIRIESANSDL